MQFLYSLDGQNWAPLGAPAGPLVQDWSLSHFMGYRFGIFNYALAQAGGHVDVDHYLLSGTLTADAKALDRSLLDASIGEAQGIREAQIDAELWAELQAALTAARAVSGPSTQNQIDAPAYRLAALVAQAKVGATDPTPTPTPTPTATPTPTPRRPPRRRLRRPHTDGYADPDPTPTPLPSSSPTPTRQPRSTSTSHPASTG
ncbi:beta-xylosidase family glycoside hydrolase [Tessaracoccus coleopterorum]|uniref:beta-xylosidase family glycoside hydrolase n=1 Tax=Tessaracoccus coleopterorum TaxID=2714950 RepID=UPI002F91904E